MGIETEIKVRLLEPVAEFRSKLEALGYQVLQPRVLEADQLYDFANGELRASGRLLRLRESGGAFVLTYKGPSTTGVHKSREEIETTVAEGTALRDILQRLGYQPNFRYEKYRTIFAIAGEEGIITVDETPIGAFLELEGSAAWIDSTAVRLEIKPKDYITASYASLYVEERRKNPALPDSMTF